MVRAGKDSAPSLVLAGYGTRREEKLVPRIATASRIEDSLSAQAEPLTYLHPELSGFFSLCSAGRTRGWHEELLPLSALESALTTRRAANRDFYVSQAEYYDKSRCVLNLKRVSVCFADLDTYKTKKYTGLPPESVCELLLDYCYSNSIPEPSIVVFSGQGLQVKWCLTAPAPAEALPRWQAVQAQLCRVLAEFGADRGAIDAARVLRLVGTVNQKSGQVARVLHVARTPTMGGSAIARGLVGYDFEEFLRTVLPESRGERKAASPASSQRGDASHPPKGGLRPPSARSLAWDRLHDLLRLADIRGWKRGARAGSRDIPVFLGAVFISHAVLEMKDFDKEVEALARRFAPNWTSRQVAQCVSSVKKKFLAAQRGETVVFNGRPVDPRYKYTNASLIELLGITRKEQEQLKTIIGPEERTARASRRKSAWRERARASGRLVSRAEKAKQRTALCVAAYRLRADGFTWSEVAARLGFKTGDAARKAAQEVRE